MSDIASELNISKNTVSRALRGLSGVSDSVRKKILAQAESSGYKVKIKENTLLHIVMVHMEALLDDNFFWPKVLSGIMNFAANQGISIRVVTVDSNKDNTASIMSIDNQKCDGILAINDLDDRTLRQLSELKLPLVVIDYFSDIINCDFVVTANRIGIHKVLSHLIENNHKRIGFIGNINWRYSFQERFDAFRSYMAKCNLPVDNDYVWLDSEYKDLSYFRKKIKQFLPSENAVTAWVCVNDVMAVDLINALKENGYKIPDDFSVVGFDNIAYPGTQVLTTLEVQIKSLGQRAIEQLMCRIEFPEKAHEILCIDTKLIIRDSVKKLPEESYSENSS